MREFATFGPDDVARAPDVETAGRARTWILADAHAGSDRSADDALVELIALGARHRVELIVLGDLFTAWLAPRRFWTASHRRVLDALSLLRRSGGYVRFVVGNRDYLAAESELDAFDRVHDGFIVIGLSGTPTLLLHGHGIDTRDRGYARWHRWSRNDTSMRVLARLPGTVGRALVGAMERALRTLPTRSEHYGIPRQSLRALAECARSRGAHRVLMGHYHEPAIIEEGCAVPVHIAPAWFRHRRILEVADDGRLITRAPADLIDAR